MWILQEMTRRLRVKEMIGLAVLAVVTLYYAWTNNLLNGLLL